ncbi:LysR family transcriptional regulator [Spongiactinospora sp. 9N601]|uniref:LysR family transcriptional regulator n=1 Tax=Spongiactinospora sp. 9N601 TaxID=3375149 RepID=UPI0037B59B5A
MELRDIEIFLTLAEELHFGRTAERLHVTQARVSQAIKKQERRIGAALFERNNRAVALTPVGKQLYADILPMYRGLHEGMERARQAARGTTGVLRLGLIPSNFDDYRPLIDAYTAAYPGAEVQLRHTHFGDPFGSLRSAETDIGVIWLPVNEPDLTVGPVVYTESVVLAAARSSPLASRESITYEDLHDQVVMDGACPAYWREALVPTHTPSGRPIQIGPTVGTWEQMLPIVVSGEAVSPVHAHVARYYSRPDIAYIPITDALPARWALIWRTAGETDLVRAFVRNAEQASR